MATLSEQVVYIRPSMLIAITTLADATHSHVIQVFFLPV